MKGTRDPIRLRIIFLVLINYLGIVTLLSDQRHEAIICVTAKTPQQAAE